MTFTTSYGTWVNHGDRHNTTVEATIADAVNGADADWRHAMETTGALNLIAGAYRQAVNDALPDGVCLAGDDFYGPYGPDDEELDIAEIIEGVDLYAIIERYDIPGALEAAQAAAEEADTAAKLATTAASRRAEAVAAAVQACGGNQTHAAHLLGIDQSTVSKLVKKANTMTAKAASEALTQAMRDHALSTAEASDTVRRMAAAEAGSASTLTDRGTAADMPMNTAELIKKLK